MKSSPMSSDQFDTLLDHLRRLESAVADLARQRAAKAWYTPDEVAEIIGRAKFTVREWCRHSRVRAEKQRSGRGKHRGWVISHEELLRIQREGLLPQERTSSSI